MARRHHSLLSAVLIALALAAGSCSASDDQAEPASTSISQDEPTTSTQSTSTQSTSTESSSTESSSTESSSTEAAEGTAPELFPDVIDATATQAGDGTWTVSATLSSPYDSPERYADAWRVVGPDGTEYGVRILTHDHASEQPFTRSHSGIEIPDDVTTVTIEGRDQVSGWGGDTFELALDR